MVLLVGRSIAMEKTADLSSLSNSPNRGQSTEQTIRKIEHRLPF